MREGGEVEAVGGVREGEEEEEKEEKGGHCGGVGRWGGGAMGRWVCGRGGRGGIYI